MGGLPDSTPSVRTGQHTTLGSSEVVILLLGLAFKTYIHVLIKMQLYLYHFPLPFLPSNAPPQNVKLEGNIVFLSSEKWCLEECIGVGTVWPCQSTDTPPSFLIVFMARLATFFKEFSAMHHIIVKSSHLAVQSSFWNVFLIPDYTWVSSDLQVIFPVWESLTG